MPTVQHPTWDQLQGVVTQIAAAFARETRDTVPNVVASVISQMIPPQPRRSV